MSDGDNNRSQSHKQSNNDNQVNCEAKTNNKTSQLYNQNDDSLKSVTATTKEDTSSLANYTLLESQDQSNQTNNHLSGNWMTIIKSSAKSIAKPKQTRAIKWPSAKVNTNANKQQQVNDSKNNLIKVIASTRGETSSLENHTVLESQDCQHNRQSHKANVLPNNVKQAQTTTWRPKPSEFFSTERLAFYKQTQNFKKTSLIIVWTACTSWSIMDQKSKQ